MDKALQYLSIARKGGMAELGEEPVGAIARAGKAYLILVAADASDHTWRRAKSSDTRMAAAPPQVGGQAIRRVITPGQMGASFSTSSAVTSLRKMASGLRAAWRLALARIFAKEDSVVPCFFMWLRPAPPNRRNAMGTPVASTTSTANP